MSKIFVENSAQAARAYSKRFAEWATVWLNKYRYDPFFRTEVNVVALQVAFALVIVGIIGTSFSLVYHNIAVAIVEGIRASLASNAPTTLGPTIVHEVEQIRTQNLIVIVSVIALTTVLFGFIVAHVTLRPARNALASQKQFIGNIAHELRTPLSIIKTNTEVALFENNMQGDLKRMLESTVEELDRISEIINNLLSLSALVRPERVEFAAVALAPTVQEAVQKLSQLVKRAGLQVTVSTSPECVVWGNSAGLMQIVMNLLKNAIQYSSRGDNVRVTLEPRPNNQIELTVQDSGIGIARKDLFRIFEPFYRGDPSRTRAAGGSGLGLAIVSELVKMHRGKISIRSAVGRGTTVSILFPGVAGRGVVGKEASAKGSLDEIAVDFSNHR